jgi:hypothetical protein
MKTNKTPDIVKTLSCGEDLKGNWSLSTTETEAIDRWRSRSQTVESCVDVYFTLIHFKMPFCYAYGCNGRAHHHDNCLKFQADWLNGRASASYS